MNATEIAQIKRILARGNVLSHNTLERYFLYRTRCCHVKVQRQIFHKYFQVTLVEENRFSIFYDSITKNVRNMSREILVNIFESLNKLNCFRIADFAWSIEANLPFSLYISSEMMLEALNSIIVIFFKGFLLSLKVIPRLSFPTNV